MSLIPFAEDVAEARKTALIVDDDVAVGAVLFGLLKQAGWQPRHETSGEAALAVVASQPFDVVITDLRMPGMDGMALLTELAARDPELPVIMLTAHGTIEVAVEAMKRGAADFLVKPFDRENVLYVLEKAVAAAGAERPPDPAPRSGDILGSSKAMADCLALVERAAKTNATVLIRGESGTGKELVARAIHDRSARKNGPFIAVHCAALPDSLLESELFGYEKGAFTGATSKKPGRVELADTGTLFLDEIGDVSLGMQVKLLRLLQEREYQPLGGTTLRKADVRFAAATHQDLEAKVRAGELREDLFYRLDVLTIRLPTLRERGDDVRILAASFCAALAKENGRAGLAFTDAALAALATHTFPGNVRELSNVVERLVVFSDGDAITEADVARELGGRSRIGAVGADPPGEGTLEEHRAAAERAAIEDALARTGGNRTKAARLLGVSRRTLYNRLDELAIR